MLVIGFSSVFESVCNTKKTGDGNYSVSTPPIFIIIIRVAAHQNKIPLACGRGLVTHTFILFWALIFGSWLMPKLATTYSQRSPFKIRGPILFSVNSCSYSFFTWEGGRPFHINILENLDLLSHCSLEENSHQSSTSEDKPWWQIISLSWLQGMVWKSTKE